VDFRIADRRRGVLLDVSMVQRKSEKATQPLELFQIGESTARLSVPSLPCGAEPIELVNWKFARWINVGCFIVAGCFWLTAALWWRSDPFFGVLLIIALGLLTIGGLTEVIYRATRSESADTA
jgi:hypothetical protein